MSLEVHVRIRPGCASCIWASAESVLYSTDNPSTRYIYNKVHPSNSTNSTIFQGLEALVHAAWGGKNVTIMAYGQTGSGKTHSMVGNANDPGIIVRTAKLLLELTKSSAETRIMAYYTEIYNETVRDLLDSTAKKLDLHDAPDGGVTFNKEVRQVKNLQDFCNMQEEAERHRRYAVTDIHDHSSRSHVILTFEIVRSGVMGRSVINLVDLAGSESASRANTEGSALREGGHINRSLLALGNVVDAIVEKRSYVPYRDAKLTRLLRTHLGGNGLTLIICCINPSRENRDQTIAALRFTQRAMKIKTDPVVSLPIPPLFTHQYAECALEMASKVEEYGVEAYERGMRDAFVFANNTASFVVKSFQSEVNDSLQALAGAQRLLVAHDHAIAVSAIDRLHEKLHELQRRHKQNNELVESEQKRCRELDDEVASRRGKLAKLESTLVDKESSCVVEVANWQYAVRKAHAKQVSEMKLLFSAERAGRSHIEYEYIICIDRITSGCLPSLQSDLSCAIDHHLRYEKSVDLISNNKRSSVNHSTIENNTNEGNDIDTSIEGKATDNKLNRTEEIVVGVKCAYNSNSTLNELRDLLDKRQSEVADLEVAYELVHEDIARAKMQQRLSAELHIDNKENKKNKVDRNGNAKLSAVPHDATSQQVEQRARELQQSTIDELDKQIEELAEEERNLLMRAKLLVRRQSIRNIRRSLSAHRYYDCDDNDANIDNHEKKRTSNVCKHEKEEESEEEKWFEPTQCNVPQKSEMIKKTLTSAMEKTNQNEEQQPQEKTVKEQKNEEEYELEQNEEELEEEVHKETSRKNTHAAQFSSSPPPLMSSPSANSCLSPLVSCANSQRQTFSWLSQGSKCVGIVYSPSRSPMAKSEPVEKVDRRARSVTRHERRQSSRERYAESVRNALSVLNNLKSRLCLRRTETPASMSSESPVQELESKEAHEEQEENQQEQKEEKRQESIELISSQESEQQEKEHKNKEIKTSLRSSEIRLQQHQEKEKVNNKELPKEKLHSESKNKEQEEKKEKHHASKGQSLQELPAETLDVDECEVMETQGDCVSVKERLSQQEQQIRVHHKKRSHKKGKSRSRSATPPSASCSTSRSATPAASSHCINVDSDFNDESQENRNKHHTLRTENNNNNNNLYTAVTSSNSSSGDIVKPKEALTSLPDKIEFQTRTRMRRRQRNERLNNTHTPPNLWVRWQSNEAKKMDKNVSSNNNNIIKSYSYAQKHEAMNKNTDDTLTLLELYNRQHYREEEEEQQKQQEEFNNTSKPSEVLHSQSNNATESNVRNRYEEKNEDKENVVRYVERNARGNIPASHKHKMHHVNTNSDNIILVEDSRHQSWQIKGNQRSKSRAKDEEKLEPKVTVQHQDELQVARHKTRRAPVINISDHGQSNQLEELWRQERARSKSSTPVTSGRHKKANRRREQEQEEEQQEEEEEQSVRVERVLWAMNGNTHSRSPAYEERNNSETELI